MDGYESMERMNEANKKARQQSKENYKYESRRRLSKLASTKIETTMIGSLSVVEKHLGYLWGQGKHPADLTDAEIKMRAVKDQIRTEILNNGNNQKRALMNEISQYEMEWKRYHTEFKLDEYHRDII